MNKYNRTTDETTPLVRSLIKYLPIGAMSTHAVIKSMGSMQNDLIKQSLSEDVNGKLTEIGKAVVNNRETSNYISQYYSGGYEFQIPDLWEIPVNHAYAFGDAFMNHLNAAGNPYVLAGFIMSGTIASVTWMKAEQSRQKGKESAFFYKKESAKILKDSLSGEDFTEYKKMGKYLSRGSNVISQLLIDIKDSNASQYIKDNFQKMIGLHADSELTAIAISNAIQDMYISKSGRLRSRDGNILISKDLEAFNNPGTSIKTRSKIEKKLARVISKHRQLYKEIVGLEHGGDYRPKYTKELLENEINALSNEDKEKYENDMAFKSLMGLRAVTDPLVMEELRERGYTAEGLIKLFSQHMNAAFENDKQLSKIFPHETSLLNEVVENAGKKLQLKAHSEALAVNISSYYRFEDKLDGKTILSAKESKKLSQIKNNLSLISNITERVSREPVYHELELIAQGVLKDIENRGKNHQKCMQTMMGENTTRREMLSLCSSSENVFNEFVSKRLLKHGYDLHSDDSELMYMSGALNQKVIDYLNLRIENKARDIGDYYIKTREDDESARLKSYYKKKEATETALWTAGVMSVAASIAMAYDPTLKTLNIFGEATSISNVITHISSTLTNPSYLLGEIKTAYSIFENGTWYQQGMLAGAAAITLKGFTSTLKAIYYNRELNREGHDIQRHPSWEVVKKYVESSKFDNEARKNRVFSSVIRNEKNLIHKLVDRSIKNAISYNEADFIPLGKQNGLGRIRNKFRNVIKGIYCPTHEAILSEMDQEYIRNIDIMRQLLVDDASEVGADIRKVLKIYDPDGETFNYFKNNFDDYRYFLSKDEMLLEQAFKNRLSLDNVLKPLIHEINQISKKTGNKELELNDHVVIQDKIFREADKMANLHIRCKAFAKMMGEAYENNLKIANTVNERDIIKEEMAAMPDKDSVEYQKLKNAYEISAREINYYVEKHEIYRSDLAAFRSACTAFSGYDDEYKPLQIIADEFAKVYHGDINRIDENVERFRQKFNIDFKDSELRHPHSVMNYIIAPIYQEKGIGISWQASEYSYLAKSASKYIKDHIQGISQDILGIETATAADNQFDVATYNNEIQNSLSELQKSKPEHKYSNPMGLNLKGTMKPEDFIKNPNNDNVFLY